jgi:DNA polymerase (family 10)
MPLRNSEVASFFDQIADMLSIEGANRFRIRAYENAARTIESLPRSIEDMVENDEDLTALPGVGKEIAEKIREIVKTGRLTFLDEIAKRTPLELRKMLELTGVGPRKVQVLYTELGIRSLAQLEEAARAGKIQSLEGFGKKSEENILKELLKKKDAEVRILRDEAEEIAEPLLAALRSLELVQRVEAAGSYRRKRETVGDLDILATASDGKGVMEHFVGYEDVQEVVSRGETRTTVLLRGEFQVDLRVVPDESYGAALLYFTGSKAHNIVLRQMALDRGWKINEYGVFEGERRIAGATEEEIYALLGLPYIPPELREDRGEFAAAKEKRLPNLITRDDLRGDLQMHTDASDGQNTLAEMAEAARALGHEYIAITDHSSYVGVTGGLDAERLARRIEEIERFNETLEGLRVLKSIEVDILQDGALDLPDEILEKLDIVVASVHSYFNLSQEQQTERIIRAMDNPHVHIFAHPTGRLIGKREPYDVDMERVMRAALARGCYLEVNAHPQRLDLNDVYCKMAKDMGLKLAISTDAHRASDLNLLRFGIDQARRGWLEPEDVLNTRPWDALRELIRRK